MFISSMAINGLYWASVSKGNRALGQRMPLEGHLPHLESQISGMCGWEMLLNSEVKVQRKLPGLIIVIEVKIHLYVVKKYLEGLAVQHQLLLSKVSL